MPDEQIAHRIKLTDKQREVLDLVVQHQSSKEIARRLGISPFTVDQRIASARKKLGAGSRAELARLYGRQISICDESVYQFPHIAEPLILPQDGNQDQTNEPVFTLNDVSQFQRSTPWEQIPERLSGLEALDNRFGVGGRIAAILAFATALAFVLAAMMAVAETLSRLI
jgi:DNA-binding CsgD family transcriptional regulator